jgi:intracellular septation protein A
MGLRLLLGPIEMLAAVVPFLQSIVGFSAGVIAFLLAIPITLITIALTWIYVRPVLGLGLVLLSLFTIFGLRTLIKNKSTS